MGYCKLPMVKQSSTLYLQLARTLRAEILCGTFPLGSQLPTESELCARFAVSRQTVREALRRLREDHLVASRQGAGTIVVSGHEDAYAQDILSVNDLVVWARSKRFGIESMEMSAALELERTYRLSNLQVAQITVSTHPADPHRHSTTLRRVKR